MSSEIAVKVEKLSKCYHIYDQPRDRLKQMILPRLRRAIGIQPKQYYREYWALKDVSFEIKKGETVGIIGRNGCGKSTLLQMICGILNPTSGSIQTNGRIAALLELGSGFNPEFTGRENVYLNGAMLGLSKEEIDRRFDQIAAFADIGDFIDQPVKTYSSGMFVRLAFSIQANVDPEILIVDEALAVGDAYFVHKCMLRIKELQSSGVVILFVSHDANTVRHLCFKSIWLVSGEIKECGDSGKVVDAYLADLFGQKASTTERGPSDLTGKLSGLSNFERVLPNIDRRLGDQSCEIIGVGLYDKNFERVNLIYNDEELVLRMTVHNNSLGYETQLVFGYIFRNAKGHEIASSNSHIEKTRPISIKPGGYSTVRITIDLPCLHPGSYAFSVAAGYLDESGEIKVSDRIENVVVFDVLSKKLVHTLMSFESFFEVEQNSELVID